MKTYQFIKTENEWYIDLPEYLEQGGTQGDLQMVEGADKMLDIMSSGQETVSLTIAKNPFEGADHLILTEKCDPYLGGGYYLMKQYKGMEINQTMWLCRVTEFVFGDIPPEIYVRSEKR
jgi:hypothetical protein